MLGSLKKNKIKIPFKILIVLHRQLAYQQCTKELKKLVSYFKETFSEIQRSVMLLNGMCLVSWVIKNDIVDYTVTFIKLYWSFAAFFLVAGSWCPQSDSVSQQITQQQEIPKRWRPEMPESVWHREQVIVVYAMQVEESVFALCDGFLLMMMTTMMMIVALPQSFICIVCVSMSLRHWLDAVASSRHNDSEPPGCFRLVGFVE